MIVFGENDGSQEGLELPKLNSKRGISSIVEKTFVACILPFVRNHKVNEKKNHHINIDRPNLLWGDFLATYISDDLAGRVDRITKMRSLLLFLIF